MSVIVSRKNMKRMPDTCKKCCMSYFPAGTEYSAEVDDRLCSLTNRWCPTEQAPSGNTRYVKPDWCPLMEV